MSAAHKVIGKAKYGEAFGLRPGTELHRWKLFYIFNTGGMGDFVNYAAATQWVAKNCPWVEAKVFVPRYLVPIFKDIHAVNPSWQVVASEEIKNHMQEVTALIGPDVHIGGINRSPQFLTCVGAHPIDVGFAYYAGTTPPPPDGLLPTLNYPKENLHESLEGLSDKYIVIPTGNVHEARKVTGKEINPIVAHVRSLGFLPVFLGKKDSIGNRSMIVRFPDDVDYHLGLDLRDKTSVKEAACIMQHAACTVGLDCGLLHLAALMKDSKIIFGYNVTTVAHREPRRNHGRHINLTLTENELRCIGCQSKLKQIAVHQFDKCLYGDSKCIEMLFEDDSRRWRDAIDEILRDNVQI